MYRLIQKLTELQFKHRESHLSKPTNSYQVPCSPHFFKLLTMFLSCIPGHKLTTLLPEWRPYTQRHPQRKQQLLEHCLLAYQVWDFISLDTKPDKTVLCVPSAPHKAGHFSHLFYVPVGQRHGPIFSPFCIFGQACWRIQPAVPCISLIQKLQGPFRREKELPLHNSYHVRSGDHPLTELSVHDEEHNNKVTG